MWHRFRRTYATLLDKAATERHTLQYLMGHSTRRMTEHYIDKHQVVPVSAVSALDCVL